MNVCLHPGPGLCRGYLNLLIINLVLAGGSTLAQNWTTTTAPSANWISVASSADGNHLAALIQGGEEVYISTNAGATWTISSPANGGAQGSCIASSADGSVLYFNGNTQIFRSTNSGATWSTQNSPSENWTSVACSADGKMAAATSAIRRSSTAGVFTSVDTGNTWNFSTAPTDDWLAIASSADGNRLVALDILAAAIYTSTDAGNTWAQHSPPPQAFSAAASSADGIQLVATSGNGSTANGPIFISTNGGLNWAPTTAPVTNWTTVACSADGHAIIAAGGGTSFLGHLFLSTDGGASWHQTNALLTHWTSVAVSADGTKFVAAEFGGHIYTLDLSPFTPSPVLDLKGSTSNVVISWLVPSMSFKLQENADLTTSNWIDVPANPMLNLINLHNEVTLPLTATQLYYRLSAGTGTAGSGIQAIAAVLQGPWQTLVVDTLFTPTFNVDGTFTATIQPSAGGIITDSGTWTLTPPVVPSGFSNPQGHLTLTDSLAKVLLSGDVLLTNPDQLIMSSATDQVSTTTFVPQLVISKVTP